jgi:hypothetical protein
MNSFVQIKKIVLQHVYHPPKTWFNLLLISDTIGQVKQKEGLSSSHYLFIV